MSEKESGKHKIAFSEYVAMYGAMCMSHLGQIPNPATGKIEYNLPAVQDTISLLEMLRDKTEGNLDDDEKKILNDTIYGLQMGYVNAVKAGVPKEVPQPEEEKKQEPEIVTPKPKIYTPYDH